MKYYKKINLYLWLTTALIFSANNFAESYLRYNQAGYQPQRSKRIIVMSDNQKNNAPWQLTNSAGVVVSSGKLTTSLYGKSAHTAKPYNYLIDISDIITSGDYQLTVNNISTNIIIAEQPYKILVNPMLRFLRVARSGTSDTLLTPASHLGDQKAIIYRPEGDIKQGKWQRDSQDKTVDMLGGWYDAGDYIKFTLTTAYTTYYLLRAYQENPALFNTKYSQTDLVDILDEAQIGLDYLVKTFPTNNEFIIQVSTGEDHNQGQRLPQNDNRDGYREALSAISPAHMGLTSAALALGSQIFSSIAPEKSQQYKQAASAIYHRARADDALTTAAFERDSTNDFYHDDNNDDNMGLAAIELYLLTAQNNYLEQAKQYSQQASNGSWAAWCCVTSSLNYRLNSLDSSAQALLQEELQGFKSYDKNSGNIWGIPMQPSWAPLPGTAIAASYTGLTFLQDKQQDPQLLWDNLDYFLGRNNWGVSFVALPSLPKAAFHTYSQVYQLTGEYPLGAVAEGPGSKSTYLDLQQYFTPTAEDDYYQQFNTASQVFFDNSSNFQTMESTITGQATTLYMIAIASKVKSTTEIAAINIPPAQPPTPATEQQNSNSSGGVSWWLLLLTITVLFYKKHKQAIKL